MTSTIVVDVSSRGVASISLNRPERGNAFNQSMLDELGECFLALADDAQARIVVLRGRGKHFCTGADISGRGEGAGGLTFNEVLARMDRFPKPVIVLVQGGCVGGGLGFAACGDVLLADESAFFSVPELRVGIAPSSQLSGLLIRTMGYRAFRRFGLSGERIVAEEALRIGLAHQVLGPGEVDGQLARIVDAFLHSAPGALKQLKETIAEHAVPRGEVLFSAADVKHGFARSPEAVEGLAAFREKRKPSWYIEADG